MRKTKTKVKTRPACEGCGKPAGGGQRFCWSCLGRILSRPTKAKTMKFENLGGGLYQVKYV